MINISRSVIDVLQVAAPLPDLQDKAAVKAYMQKLEDPVATLVSEIAKAVAAGKVGLVGMSPEEVRNAVAEELEARQVELNPALVEAIVQIILFIISRLAKD